MKVPDKGEDGFRWPRPDEVMHEVIKSRDILIEALERSGIASSKLREERDELKRELDRLTSSSLLAKSVLTDQLTDCMRERDRLKIALDAAIKGGREIGKERDWNEERMLECRKAYGILQRDLGEARVDLQQCQVYWGGITKQAEAERDEARAALAEQIEAAPHDAGEALLLAALKERDEARAERDRAWSANADLRNLEAAALTKARQLANERDEARAEVGRLQNQADYLARSLASVTRQRDHVAKLLEQLHCVDAELAEAREAIRHFLRGNHQCNGPWWDRLREMAGVKAALSEGGE